MGEASAKGQSRHDREVGGSLRGRGRGRGRGRPILVFSERPPATVVMLTRMGRCLADGNKGGQCDHGSFGDEMHCSCVVLLRFERMEANRWVAGSQVDIFGLWCLDRLKTNSETREKEW